MAACKATLVASVPGVPNTNDTVHQCSGNHKPHDEHYCGCGHQWG